jgi:molybdopterin-guanine dinucleotide biosynthesis protein A
MSGVVLAGGASRRMGTEKARVEVGGQTFLQRTLGILRAAGAAPVLVAAGAAGRLGPITEADGEVGDDERFRGDGPLAGILAALRAAEAGPHHHVAVLAVDLVDGSPDLLRWLRHQWRGGDVALVPADATGRPQPLHAVVGRDLAPALEAALAAGERRVLRVFDTAGARTLTPPPELADAVLGWSRNRNRPNREPGIDPTPGGLGGA